MATPCDVYYQSFKSYLGPPALEGFQNSQTFRKDSRGKLQKLPRDHFIDLTTDVYDELVRRSKPSKKVPFLPASKSFSVRRNQARQKLGTLSDTRFKDLVNDLFIDLLIRFPELDSKLRSSIKDNSNIRGPPFLSPPSSARASTFDLSNLMNDILDRGLSNYYSSSPGSPDSETNSTQYSTELPSSRINLESDRSLFRNNTVRATPNRRESKLFEGVAFKDNPEHLQKDYHRLRQEHEQTIARLRKARGLVETLSTENNQLKNSVTELEKLNNEKDSQLKKITPTIDGSPSLASDHAKLTEKYDMLNDDHKVLTKSHGELQESHEELTLKFRELGKLHDELNQTHDQISKSHEELTQSHQQLQKTHEQLEKTHQDLSHEYDDLQSQHQEMSQVRGVLIKQIEEFGQEREGLQSRQAESTQQLEALSIDHDELSKKFEELNQSHIELEQRHQGSSQDYGTLQEKLQTLQQECDQLHQQHEELTQERGQQVNITDELNRERDELNGKLEALTLKYEELAKEREELYRKPEELTKAHEELRKEYQLDMENLSLRYEELESSHNKQLTIIETLGKTNEVLELKLHEVNQALESSQQDSMLYLENGPPISSPGDDVENLLISDTMMFELRSSVSRFLEAVRSESREDIQTHSEALDQCGNRIATTADKFHAELSDPKAPSGIQILRKREKLRLAISDLATLSNPAVDPLPLYNQFEDGASRLVRMTEGLQLLLQTNFCSLSFFAKNNKNLDKTPYSSKSISDALVNSRKSSISGIQDARKLSVYSSHLGSSPPNLNRMLRPSSVSSDDLLLEPLREYLEEHTVDIIYTIDHILGHIRVDDYTTDLPDRMASIYHRVQQMLLETRQYSAVPHLNNSPKLTGVLNSLAVSNQTFLEVHDELAPLATADNLSLEEVDDLEPQLKELKHRLATRAFELARHLKSLLQLVS